MKKMFVQGVKDKVVCKIVEQDKISDGGIIIPPTAQKDPNLTCEIISVGDEVECLTKGDIIFCHRSGGMDMVYNNEIVKILKYDEIYGVLREE